MTCFFWGWNPRKAGTQEWFYDQEKHDGQTSNISWRSNDDHWLMTTFMTHWFFFQLSIKTMIAVWGSTVPSAPISWGDSLNCHYGEVFFFFAVQLHASCRCWERRLEDSHFQRSMHLASVADSVAFSSSLFCMKWTNFLNVRSEQAGKEISTWTKWKEVTYDMITTDE